MANNNGNGLVLVDMEGHKTDAPAYGSGSNGSQPGDESGLLTKVTTPETGRALHRLERMVRAHPENAVYWFDFGKLLLDAGQYPRAEAVLQEALRRAPDSANCRFYLANALAGNNKFPEAASHFKYLADLDPELKDPMSTLGLTALSHLGYCLGKMDRWKEAFDTLQPAMGIATSIFSHLAKFLSRSGDYDRACFLLSVALLIAPGDDDLLYGAGYCHMKAGRLREALEYLRKASKANPEDPDIWYDLGLTLARMRRGKEARRCFRKVLQLDAKYPWAWYDLACLEALEKKPNSAFRNLYKAIECGFEDLDYLRRDPDFRSIRKDPRWRVVLDCIADRDAPEEADGMSRQ